MDGKGRCQDEVNRRLTFLPVPSLPGVGVKSSPPAVDEGSKQERWTMTSCCVCEAGTNGELIHCETPNRVILFDDDYEVVLGEGWQWPRCGGGGLRKKEEQLRTGCLSR